MIANSTRTALWVGVLAATSISIAACGGSDSDSGGSTGDPEAFCAMYEGFDNPGDGGIVGSLEELRALAPSELQDDFDDALDAFDVLREFNEAGEEIDPSDPGVVEATDRLDAAGVKIEQYVAETCGLES